MKVTAIVPSLNPDEKFLHVVEQLVDAGFSTVLLVDDGSRPENRVWFERAAQYPQCTVLRHNKNLGKGRALKTAMNYFLNLENGDVGVVTLDGDGQHSIEDVIRCAQALEEHPKDLILGVRDFNGKDVPSRSSFGNKATSFVFRVLCGIPVTDTQTGLRGISSEFARHLLDVSGERFEFETNMLLETRRAEVAIREVTIRTLYLEENKSSHFRPFRDSVSIYRLILKYCSSSLISWAVEYGLFVLFSLLLKNVVAGYISILIATAVGRIVSSVCNFALNRAVVFRSREKLGKTLVRYYILCVIQMFLSFGGVYLLTLIGCPEAVAKIPVDIILFCASFRIQRMWVFQK